MTEMERGRAEAEVATKEAVLEAAKATTRIELGAKEIEEIKVLCHR